VDLRHKLSKIKTKQKYAERSGYKSLGRLKQEDERSESSQRRPGPQRHEKQFKAASSKIGQGPKLRALATCLPMCAVCPFPRNYVIIFKIPYS
jgi:hypothetical protein